MKIRISGQAAEIARGLSGQDDLQTGVLLALEWGNQVPFQPPAVVELEEEEWDQLRRLSAQMDSLSPEQLLERLIARVGYAALLAAYSLERQPE